MLPNDICWECLAITINTIFSIISSFGCKVMEKTKDVVAVFSIQFN